MIKIFILAYLIGTIPTETSQYFQIGKSFNTMEECKKELTLNSRTVPGIYDITLYFIKQGNFEWDWVTAFCYDSSTKEKFSIYPQYDNGIPEGIKNLLENKL